MTEDEKEHSFHDPWGDEAAEQQRSEPFLSSEDGAHSMGFGEGTRFAGGDTGFAGAGGDALQGGVQAEELGHKEKRGKKTSTAKMALMIGGGAVLVTVVGATGFWFMTKPAAAPAQAHSSSMQFSARNRRPLPGSQGYPAHPQASVDGMIAMPQPKTAPTMPAYSSTASVPTASPSSVATTDIPVTPAVMAPSQSADVYAQAVPMISAPTVSTALTSSVSPSDRGTQVAALRKEIRAMRSRLHKEKTALAAARQTSAAPRVIYRTIVRDVPVEPRREAMVSGAKPAIGNDALPSGYVLAGGGGSSALVRTPDGEYKTIRSGDTLDGRVVKSVHNGHLVMGGG